MTRKTTTHEQPTIVLKTVIRDIERDNNVTLNDKKIRARLRATPSMMELHVKNSSWIFTQSQYDVVRSMFDATYRAKIERAQKRATKTNTTPRKRNVKTNVVLDNVIDENNVKTNETISE